MAASRKKKTKTPGDKPSGVVSDVGTDSSLRSRLSAVESDLEQIKSIVEAISGTRKRRRRPIKSLNKLLNGPQPRIPASRMQQRLAFIEPVFHTPRGARGDDFDDE